MRKDECGGGWKKMEGYAIYCGRSMISFNETSKFNR
jgi:hypothetical protein